MFKKTKKQRPSLVTLGSVPFTRHTRHFVLIKLVSEGSDALDVGYFLTYFIHSIRRSHCTVTSGLGPTPSFP